MNKYFSSVLLACVMVTQSASADVLCMRRIVTADRKSVPLASAFRVAEAKCPSGFNKMLDTEDLAGEAGDSGTPLASYSGCTRKSMRHTKVNSGSDDSWFFYVAACNAGEYAHSAEETITYAYSNDWVHGGSDSSMAGKSYMAPAKGTSSPPDLLDANGIASGFTLSVGGRYLNSSGEESGLSTPITGSLTTTADVRLLCCKTDR